LGEPAADTSAPILAADQVKAVRGAASDEIRLSKTIRRPRVNERDGP
jgi:hypothetical protein